MKLMIPLLLVLLTFGCSSHQAHRYSLSIDNSEYIKYSIQFEPNKKIKVADFTSVDPGKKSIMCRLMRHVEMPGNQSFENYIRTAFVDELRLAGAYSESGNIVIKGHLERADFNSTTGHWYLVLILSSEYISYRTSIDFDYPTELTDVPQACSDTALAFMPAVQFLIREAVKHPDFKKLINTK